MAIGEKFKKHMKSRPGPGRGWTAFSLILQFTPWKSLQQELGYGPEALPKPIEEIECCRLPATKASCSGLHFKADLLDLDEEQVLHYLHILKSNNQLPPIASSNIPFMDCDTCTGFLEKIKSGWGSQV